MSGGFLGRLFGDSKSANEAVAAKQPGNAECVDTEGRAYAPIDTPELEQLSPKLKIRQEMLADIRSSMAEFEKSVSAAKDFSSFSSTGLSSAKAMLKDVELDLDNQIKVEGENLILRNRIGDFEQQVLSLQSELENQKAVTSSAQSRLAEAQSELQRAKDNLVEYRLADDENKLVIEQLQRAHGVLENENSQRKQIIAKLESENHALNESLSQMQVELATAREAATGYEKESNEWQRVNKNTNERLENAQRDLQKLRTSHADLQRQKIELDSQLEATRNELNAEAKRVADQIRNKDSKIYSLESKNEVLEANARIASQRMDATKQDNSELQKANSILEMQVEALKTKIENTRKSHELDREALYKSSDRIVELDLTITSTIAELNQANSQRESYATLVEELTRKNAELSEKLIKLSAVEENHAQLVRAIREKSSVKSSSKAKDGDSDKDNIVAMSASKSA